MDQDLMAVSQVPVADHAEDSGPDIYILPDDPPGTLLANGAPSTATSMTGQTPEIQILGVNDVDDRATERGMFRIVSVESVAAEETAVPPAAADATRSSSRYHCSLCGMFFDGEERLRRHVIRKHGNGKLGFSFGKHQCGWCDYTTNKAGHMKRHCRTHTGDLPFQCTVDKCMQRLGTQELLDAHKMQKHWVTSMNCEFCGRGCDDKNSLKVHKTFCPERHTQALKCKMCGQQFETLSLYASHMKEHEAKAKPHRCWTCLARFSSQEQLVEHMERHNNKQKTHQPIAGLTPSVPVVRCPSCPARFRSTGLMKRHVVKTHTHQYPHQCGNCSKGFLSRHEIERHIDICMKQVEVKRLEEAKAKEDAKQEEAREVEIETVS